MDSLKRALAMAGSAAAFAGALALLDGLKLEPERLKVRRLDISAGRSAGVLAGLRVAQISDLHVGGRGWRPGTMARAIEVCNDERPDVVAITGDFLGGPEGAGNAVEVVSRLRRDLPRLAVLGNHDHVYGATPLAALLEGLRCIGIRLLRNECTILDFPSGRVWFVGVDDGFSGREDIGRTMAGLGPEHFPRILLTHYPDVAEQLPEGVFQLALAGHSHGGQVRVPGLAQFVSENHARTGHRYGLRRINGNLVYVTSGLGMSAIPVRLWNPPEVAILRFTF